MTIASGLMLLLQLYVAVRMVSDQQGHRVAQLRPPKPKLPSPCPFALARRMPLYLEPTKPSHEYLERTSSCALSCSLQGAQPITSRHLSGSSGDPDDDRVAGPFRKARKASLRVLAPVLTTPPRVLR